MNLPLLNTVLWPLPYLAVVGFGLFLLRIFRFRLLGLSDLQYAFWLGFLGIVACLQVIHFFLPVSQGVSFIFILLGTGGFIMSLRRLKDLVRGKNWRDGVFFLFAVAFAGVWIRSQAAHPPVRYDTGLYHIQFIEWLTTYPTVPGLGNFHTRFAFPQSFFFFPAFLERAFPWMGGFLICSYLFAANLLFEWTLGIRGLLFRSDYSLGNFFRAFFILPVMFYACYDSRIITASADAWLFIFVLFMTGLWVKLGETSGQEWDIRRSLPVFVFIVAAFVGITLKPAFMVFGAASLFLIALRGGMRSGKGFIFCLALGIFVPFLIRNILISGYFFFPIPFLSWPVDWRIPEAITGADCTFSYSKIADCRSVAWTDWSWMGPWLRRNWLFTGISSWGPLVLAFLGSVLGGRCLWNRKVGIALLPALLSLIMSLFFYPDCRFYGSSLWVVAGILFSAALAGRAEFLTSGQWRRIILSGLVLLSGMAVWSSAKAHPQRWRVPFDRGSFERQALSPEFSVMRLTAPDDRCWGTSLPCTPEALEGLRLRDPRRVEAGFTRSAAGQNP